MSRPSVEEIKKWYSDLAFLLNRLEGAGEELILFDNEFTREIRGYTGVVRKYSPNTPGTWSRI